MTTFQQIVRRRPTQVSHGERGATAIEFGLTIGLVATIVIVASSYFSEALASLAEIADRVF